MKITFIHAIPNKRHVKKNFQEQKCKGCSKEKAIPSQDIFRETRENGRNGRNKNEKVREEVEQGKGGQRKHFL